MFALSTPSRVQILGCLLDGGHGVSELVERLEFEQSAVRRGRNHGGSVVR